MTATALLDSCSEKAHKHVTGPKGLGSRDLFVRTQCALCTRCAPVNRGITACVRAHGVYSVGARHAFLSHLLHVDVSREYQQSVTTPACLWLTTARVNTSHSERALWTKLHAFEPWHCKVCNGRAGSRYSLQPLRGDAPRKVNASRVVDSQSNVTSPASARGARYSPQTPAMTALVFVDCAKYSGRALDDPFTPSQVSPEVVSTVLASQQCRCVPRMLPYFSSSHL